jgi:predicted nucleic acid-binding protein
VDPRTAMELYRRQAESAQQQAEALRRQLAELEALPVAEAAAQVEARAEAERVAAEALARRAAELHDFTRDQHRPSPSSGPDFGPSL